MENQKKYSRLKQRSAIKFLLAEKRKTCEIYRRICDVLGETYFCKQMFTNGLDCFKKFEIDEDWPRWLTIAITPEMTDSVNALTLTERRFVEEEISAPRGISVGTANKIVHYIHAFSKVSCRWVSVG